ncbi:MAG TPA: hypothetical protein VML57_00200 [Burkholderiales bacterium]|nr:hypothetical protein [Burkholderiales bacterium]
MSASGKDPYLELAQQIYVRLAARVYGALAGTDQRKPDPKALAAYSFKLADAFEQAARQTDRAKAAAEVASKAAVKVGDVDLSGMFGPSGGS